MTQVLNETRIEKIADLDFGEIIPGDAGGIRDDAAALVDFPTYSGPVGTDTVELTHVSIPTETMTLRTFTTDFNRTILFGLPAYLFRTTYDFRIGGTLGIAANQTARTYEGTFVVSIDCN